MGRSPSRCEVGRTREEEGRREKGVRYTLLLRSSLLFELPPLSCSSAPGLVCISTRLVFSPFPVFFDASHCNIITATSPGLPRSNCRAKSLKPTRLVADRDFAGRPTRLVAGEVVKAPLDPRPPVARNEGREVARGEGARNVARGEGRGVALDL